MRMIPATIRSGVRSQGERHVFNVLSCLNFGDGATAFHSLNLIRHEGKRVCEADFVIASPRGLFVLEIKGGRIGRADNGQWFSDDKHGARHLLTESPFDQALGALQALRKRLNEEAGHNLLARVPLGHGVVFPDCNFSSRSVEWEDWMVASGAQMEQFGLWLDRFASGWKARVPGTAATLGPCELKLVVDLLRPSFETAQSLLTCIGETEERVDSLTTDQMRFIDVLEANERILCEGGAGTGKTFLAAELARRWSDGVNRVLLCCRSPFLAEFLRTRIKAPQLDVRVIDTVRKWGQPGSYDRLIVDEGQDMMNQHDLAALDRVLLGGILSGRWCYFADSNHQAGVFGSCEASSFESLLASGPARVPLKRNCRNTAVILEEIKAYTQCDLGAEGTGEGPKVEWVAHHPNEAPAALADVLRRCRRHQIPPGQITILSARDLSDGAFGALCDEEARHITVLDPISIAEFPLSTTSAASVADFKGLENRVIVLVDLETVGDSSLRRILAYVGMSRARALLFVLRVNS